MAQEKKPASDEDIFRKDQGSYLPYDRAVALSEQLKALKITDCRESDMTLEGLVRVLDRNLEATHCSERVYWPELAVPYQGHRIGVEELIRLDPFSPAREAKGTLDLKSFMDQINQGTVYDLLENPTRWSGHRSGCYSDGIFIGEGENWPRATEKDHIYHLEFR